MLYNCTITMCALSRLLLLPISSILLNIQIVGAQNVQERSNHLQVRGNSQAIINVSISRTSQHHPLYSSNNVSLWCQVFHEENVLPISAAVFLRKHDGAHLVAEISDDRMKASYDFEKLSVNDAGNYTCLINTTKNAFANGIHQIFVRPIAVINDADHYKFSEDDIFQITGETITVIEGSDINITCSTVGFPLVKYTWSKDGNEIEPLHSGASIVGKDVIMIKMASQDDHGIYECIASNQFMVNGRMETNRLSISYRLKVKSPLAWLWPSITILILILLLAAVVIVHECRKAQNDKKILDDD